MKKTVKIKITGDIPPMLVPRGPMTPHRAKRFLDVFQNQLEKIKTQVTKEGGIEINISKKVAQNESFKELLPETATLADILYLIMSTRTNQKHTQHTQGENK